MESPEPPFAVLHLNGPPGIGKTSLLNVYATLAAEAGASVVRLDGRELVPSPQAVLGALGVVLDVQTGEGAIAPPFDDARLVVICDTYERLAPLDNWFRARLLPRLPAGVLTVIAGRIAPGATCRADPGWRELLRVVSLRNLSPDDSRHYLQECGVDRTRHDQLVELSHGHPLGLSLLADVIVRGGEAADDPLTRDLVGTLLRRFVEIVPSGVHRRALEVCAVARVTTEGLLRDVLEVEDGHEQFSWLRGLSFIESGPDGVFPHDLARDTLEAICAGVTPTAIDGVSCDPRPRQPSAADDEGPRATARDRRRQVHVPSTTRCRVAARLGRLGRAVSRAGPSR